MTRDFTADEVAEVMAESTAVDHDRPRRRSRKDGSGSRGTGEPPPREPPPRDEPPPDDDGGRLLFETGARLLSEIPRDPPPPRRLGRWQQDALNIVFGPGGVGKGILVAADIGRLVAEGERVYIVDYEDHPDEWSRRVIALADLDVGGSVLHVAPLDPRRWKGRTGALWDIAPRLRAEADDFGATWVVVDSIGPACFGSDFAKDPNVPTRYKQAVALIGRSCISIGQVNRAGDLRYPFGSVLWHYQVRGSVSIQVPPGGTRGTHLLLTDRKGNNYAQAERVQAEVIWLDDLPRSIDEQPYLLALADRIAEMLGDRAMTSGDVTAELNAEAETGDDRVEAGTVRKTLRRGLVDRPRSPRLFGVTGVGKSALFSRWNGEA